MIGAAALCCDLIKHFECSDGRSLKWASVLEDMAMFTVKEQAVPALLPRVLNNV